MPPIQLGIDIATSVSVIGAALAFIYTQLTQARRARRQGVRIRRIDQMARICDDMSGILTKGDEIVAAVKRHSAGAPLKIDADDFTEFCIAVERYLKIKIVCSFNVWATPIEHKLIDDMLSAVHKWNREFVDAHNDHTKPVPSFNKLLEDLTKSVAKLSDGIRAEIESADANE